MKKVLLTLACGLLAVSISTAFESAPGPILLTQVPVRAGGTDGSLDFCAQGSRIVLVRPGESPRILTGGFASASRSARPRLAR